MSDGISESRRGTYFSSYKYDFEMKSKLSEFVTDDILKTCPEGVSKDAFKESIINALFNINKNTRII